MKNRSILLTFLSVCFFLISFYLVYLGLKISKRGSDKNQANMGQLIPARKIMLPSGKQVYKFSHGVDYKGPRIMTLSINELTPKKGSKQILTAEVSSESPITEVVFTMMSDNEEKKLSLKKINGTDKAGVWEASWIVNDSLDIRYQIGVGIVSSTDNYSDTLIFR